MDYYGRWKAAQYYAKRFFALAMVSCMEEGVLSQNPNVNAQPYHLVKVDLEEADQYGDYVSYRLEVD